MLETNIRLYCVSVKFTNWEGIQSVRWVRAGDLTRIISPIQFSVMQSFLPECLRLSLSVRLHPLYPPLLCLSDCDRHSYRKWGSDVSAQSASGGFPSTAAGWLGGCTIGCISGMVSQLCGSSRRTWRRHRLRSLTCSFAQISGDRENLNISEWAAAEWALNAGWSHFTLCSFHLHQSIQLKLILRK